jgi:hypothetical protein
VRLCFFCICALPLLMKTERPDYCYDLLRSFVHDFARINYFRYFVYWTLQGHPFKLFMHAWCGGNLCTRNLTTLRGFFRSIRINRGAGVKHQRGNHVTILSAVHVTSWKPIMWVTTYYPSDSNRGTKGVRVCLTQLLLVRNWDSHDGLMACVGGRPEKFG